MVDFTSALYLGLHHPSWSLKPWSSLTTGRPAGFHGTEESAQVAADLAGLVGCERGTLGSSTLHLFWDLFGMIADGHAVYMDAGIYPVGRWGVERACARGIPVKVVRHYDVDALGQALAKRTSRRLRPILVTDGCCLGCGRHAPVAAYLELIRTHDGLMVIDDTQALGITGHSPGPELPLGRGGGGSMRWNNISSGQVVLISSLAKGFGVPLALLAGSDALIRGFEEKSETRVHTSPPSLAAIRAARRALHVNQHHGDELRGCLAHGVARFRRELSETGLSSVSAWLPVQTLARLPRIAVETVHQRLLRAGVRAVLHHAAGGKPPRISFLITARHTAAEIDRAASAVRDAVTIPRT
jgi:8-amino-7-oxononanoate synthase